MQVRDCAWLFPWRFTLVLMCQEAWISITALYLGICLAVKLSPSAAHNYKTASLGSLAPSFISQSHLTIFTLQTWAKESRWCSLKSLQRTQTSTVNRPAISNECRWILWFLYPFLPLTVLVSDVCLRGSLNINSRSISCSAPHMVAVV